MKNAILLHGSSCTPNSYWLPYIKKFLESNKYTVWAPQLPNTDAPNLKFQLPVVLKNGQYNKDTIIIAHSAGCPLTLSILENINVKIKKVILVSGYARKLRIQTIEPLKTWEKDAEAILQKKYDWNNIKNNVDEIIFINSDNDPWGCNDKEARHIFDNIGGTQIILHGEGHMGSDYYKQPYKEFPLLKKLLSE